MLQKHSHLNMRNMVKVFVADTTMKAMYSNLTSLASLAAILPVSTIECKQAFSAIKRFNTELRNRMKTSTFKYLMRISIEGPKLQCFDFQKAVELWVGMCNRRLPYDHTQAPLGSSQTESLVNHVCT